MFKGFSRYLSEIFQDVDGGFSAKRTALYVFVIVFVCITIYVLHYGVAVKTGAKMAYAIPAETLNFLQGAADKCIDAVKWLGTMIAAERTPQAIASFKGTRTAVVSPEDQRTESHDGAAP